MFSDVKILIVDDHDLVRMGLMKILQDIDGFTVVGQASSGEAALTSARTLCPDIVLMDLKMPGIGGIEATRRLVMANANIKVIAVTACEDELYVTRLLQAGAVAYLTKRAQPDEVVRVVKMVVAGRSYISQEIAQRLALKNSGGTRERGSPFEQLTGRELQIAIMIVNGAKVYTIADKLNISTKTVNSYRYRIFDKFTIKSDVELVHLALKHKLFDPDVLP